MRRLLLASLLVGCGASHTSGDAGPPTDGGRADGGMDASSADCTDPPPMSICAVPGDMPGCCEPVPLRCVDGEWDCPDPSSMGWACESFDCGSPPTCPGPMPRCYDAREGCCGDEVPAGCAPPSGWLCPGGALEESECTSTCAACAGLGWAACLRTAGCAATYDDACCSTCTPGPCADCTRPEFFQCASVSAACGSTPALCSQPAAWECGGAAPDCGDAFVVDGVVCSLPGCVARWPIGTPDMLSCAPVTAGTCEAACDIPAPDCGPDAIAEADGGCYTGFCVARTVCGG